MLALVLESTINLIAVRLLVVVNHVARGNIHFLQQACICLFISLSLSLSQVSSVAVVAYSVGCIGTLTNTTARLTTRQPAGKS